MAVSDYTAPTPTADAYWRAVLLFGRNSASYKFALARSLLELADGEREFVSLADLAVPFSTLVTEHLKGADRQGTGSRSVFLQACRDYNEGVIDQVRLLEETERRGFVNVLDAFHVLPGGRVPVEFFRETRRSGVRGVELGADLRRLAELASPADLDKEAEARWRLVETAWALALPAGRLLVRPDSTADLLLVDRGPRREAVTRARDALNGYQKGICFYCFGPISLDDGALTGLSSHVDHVIPVSLMIQGVIGSDLNQVWNLVLACPHCNLSKSARLPDATYLERLMRRNSFLIDSHHPLRDSLMAQMGATSEDRVQFLRTLLAEDVVRALPRWRLTAEYAPRF